MPEVPVLPDSPAGAVPPAFIVSRTNRGLDLAIVAVAGELDAFTAPRLQQKLDQRLSEARLVVLDLRELVFMDSSGVHVIANASSHARAEGRRLVVLRGPPTVDRLFSLTGTTDDVELHDLDAAEPPVQVLLKLASAA